MSGYPFRDHRTVAEVGAQRPQVATRLARFTFEAWRVCASGKAQPIEVAAETLADAVSAAALHCQHKDVFLILETDTQAGTFTLHSYTVKRKSSAKWNGERKVHDCYAERLFSMAVTEFAPVEPWRWTPGCDVVGRDSNPIIEGNPA